MLSDKNKKIRETFEQHTDYIPTQQYLICWGFNAETVEKVYSGGPSPFPVTRALVHGLKAISESKNKRLRDQRFTIWMGSYYLWDWVGIPGRISSQVTDVLDRFFRKITGFETLGYGELATMQLVPMFRYEAGRVIQYVDMEVAGKERVDGDDNFGSGLNIIYRMDMPAFVMGEEMYQG